MIYSYQHFKKIEIKKKNRKKNGKCVITFQRTLSIILVDLNSTAKKIENHLLDQKNIIA